MKKKYSSTQKMRLTRMDSLQDTIKSLILDGYEVTVRAVYQEFPRETSIDYFELLYRKLEVLDD